ncbi:hypothetical protein CYMTET_34631 [Cymbomonas tetramitiformis]|uniref:Uncharacterized protein n=1 Tax=Cymbomonas tetramitiformis TaxID=36881 RepID=A0AAE0FAR9_9CHLO|nr:hypothetical protein CYMTET_34631 [Cymbomonas tetramitiformis]
MGTRAEPLFPQADWWRSLEGFAVRLRDWRILGEVRRTADVGRARWHVGTEITVESFVAGFIGSQRSRSAAGAPCTGLHEAGGGLRLNRARASEVMGWNVLVIDMVRMLLDYGVSATAPTRYGVTPLHMALTAGQGAMPVVQLLLAAKVGLASRDDDKQSVLHHAARSGAPLKVLNVLLERMHADKAVQAAEKCLGTQLVDWTDRWRRTALHWAVVNGHRAVVVWLMEAGANVKLRDEKETALEIAERRARCGASERPDNARASTWGDIAKLLGGSGSTKNLKKSAA